MASNLQRNRRPTWLRFVLEGPVAALKLWRGMQATETPGWQMAGWCVSGASTQRHLRHQHPNDARRTAPVGVESLRAASLEMIVPAADYTQ
jgi:hypothetical protein